MGVSLPEAESAEPSGVRAERHRDTTAEEPEALAEYRIPYSEAGAEEPEDTQGMEEPVALVLASVPLGMEVEEAADEEETCIILPRSGQVRAVAWESTVPERAGRGGSMTTVPTTLP